MNIVHLTASPFFGGPERQMLGLARHLPADYQTAFLSFPEGGRCRPFLDRVRAAGFAAAELANNAPRYRACAREIASFLGESGADVLCCHGYKADLLGLPAARRARIPIVSVSRGWTGATWKVRMNEGLDRLSLRWMDRVVCVSGGQAAKVRRAGVPTQRLEVVHNAIELDRFGAPDPAYRSALTGFFPSPPTQVIGAVGRLSPEKGYGVLIEAATDLFRRHAGAGLVVFGDGPLRDELARAVEVRGLGGRFVLAGFRDDVDRLLPHLDVLVLPSFTEGLPNVVLEAFAAGVPVVATAVGGTPEVVDDGKSGYLVPPGRPDMLAARLGDVLTDPWRAREMGRAGRARVERDFTFPAQARKYQAVLAAVVGRRLTAA